MGAVFPLAIFGSGDLVVVQSYRILHEGGKDYYELKMGLTDEVKKKYKIIEDRLDFSNPEFFRGLLARQYSASDFIFLSNSPENPIWLVVANFDGSSIDLKGTKLAWLVQLKDNLDAAKVENARLRAENEDLKKELHMIVSQLAKWYKRKGILFDTSEKVSDVVAKILAMQRRTA